MKTKEKIITIILLFSGCTMKYNDHTFTIGDPSYIVGWGCLIMAISTLAQALNRSGFGWFIFGLITGPLALFCLMIVGKKEIN